MPMGSSNLEVQQGRRWTPEGLSPRQVMRDAPLGQVGRCSKPFEPIGEAPGTPAGKLEVVPAFHSSLPSHRGDLDAA